MLSQSEADSLTCVLSLTTRHRRHITLPHPSCACETVILCFPLRCWSCISISHPHFDIVGFVLITREHPTRGYGNIYCYFLLFDQCGSPLALALLFVLVFPRQLFLVWTGPARKSSPGRRKPKRKHNVRIPVPVSAVPDVPCRTTCKSNAQKPINVIMRILVKKKEC